MVSNKDATCRNCLPFPKATTLKVHQSKGHPLTHDSRLCIYKIKNIPRPRKKKYPKYYVRKLKFAYLGPVHATPEEFENGGLILKTHQMFFGHTTLEKF